MDLYANRKIKITKNALTGQVISILYDKHSNNIAEVKFKKDYLNKRYYSTSIKETSNTKLKTNDNLKNDKYLSYITPLKAKKNKSVSKVINIKDKPNKKPFSVMDIETMGFNNKEIPVSISIKTENNLKLFIIDHNLLKIDVEMAIKDL
jgi:hypothetical protein